MNHDLFTDDLFGAPWRCFLLGEKEVFQPKTIVGIESFLLSFDKLFAAVIQFVPKYLEALAGPEDYMAVRGVARSSAAVTAIERNAAIVYNSYVSNSSVVDPDGNRIEGVIRPGNGSEASPVISV